MSVGRDGASDAVSFLQAGVPAVEFGPAGAGHHGPEEWVSISSLAAYRQTLCDFVVGLPLALVRRRPARRGGRARVSDDTQPASPRAQVRLGRPGSAGDCSGAACWPAS